MAGRCCLGESWLCCTCGIRIKAGRWSNARAEETDFLLSQMSGTLSSLEQGPSLADCYYMTDDKCMELLGRGKFSVVHRTPA